MLTEPTVQAKIPSHSGDCVMGEDQLNTLSLMVKDIMEYSAYHEHGTRSGVSHLIHYGTLLQNVTDIITKCDSYFITKCDKSLLQNASGFLSQNATILLPNATVIIKCDVYYKLQQYSNKIL